MDTANDVTEQLIRIYGEEPAPTGGVLHVTAVWEDAETNLRTLRICAETPRSSTDAFVLGVARARADVIITTGASLRAEPGLLHTLDGLRRPGRALAAWRSARMERANPPASCVLTASGKLDFKHGLFRTSPRTIVYTRPAAAKRLDEEIAGAGLSSKVEVATDANSSLVAAVAYLRLECGFETVAVETGPSAAATLYPAPPGGAGGEILHVDELLLSRYQGGEPGTAVRGPVLFAADRLDESFSRATVPYTNREESGRWTFRRYRR